VFPQSADWLLAMLTASRGLFPSMYKSVCVAVALHLGLFVSHNVTAAPLLMPGPLRACVWPCFWQVTGHQGVKDITLRHRHGHRRRCSGWVVNLPSRQIRRPSDEMLSSFSLSPKCRKISAAWELQIQIRLQIYNEKSAQRDANTARWL